MKRITRSIVSLTLAVGFGAPLAGTSATAADAEIDRSITKSQDDRALVINDKSAVANSGTPMKVDALSEGTSYLALPTLGSQSSFAESVDNPEQISSLIRRDGSFKLGLQIEALSSESNHGISIEGATAVEKVGDRSFRFLGAEGNTITYLIVPAVVDANSNIVDSDVSTSLNQVSIKLGREQGNSPMYSALDAGRDLFGPVTYSTHNNRPKISFAKSEYGAANHYPWNNGMFHNEGWVEVNRKDTRNVIQLNPRSMHQQYDCHVQGGYASLAGPTWDLEVSRPAMNGDWSRGVLRHRCNWIDANGTPENGSS